MEKFYFDESTFIWKEKLEYKNSKEKILENAKYIISKKKSSTDAYGYRKEVINNTDLSNYKIHNLLDEIIIKSITKCLDLFSKETTKQINKITVETWINVVKSKNPIQSNYQKKNNEYHIHTEINKHLSDFIPNYTFIYYIQMPDIMHNNDGVLWVLGENKNEYSIKPEEDDLIIMKATLPHVPEKSPQSKLDRIVLAGNVGIEILKKENVH